MLDNAVVRNYLIIINIIGFFLYLINKSLYKHTIDGQVDILLTITSLIGGSGGILLAILLFDRKSEKENMMSRVFIACIFVIQCILLLIIKDNIFEKLSLNFSSFIEKNKILLIYLIVINIITFISFAIDKHAANNNKWRIKNVTLLGLSFIGGSIGGLIAMHTFKHKTQKDYYTVGLWLMIIMQILVLVYYFNK